MKKIIPIIAIVLVFIVGLGFLCYPLVSSVVNNIASRQEAEAEIKKFSSLGDEKIDALFAEADEYNHSLIDTVILTDTFDAESYEKIGAHYRETFDVNGKGLIGYVTIPKINVYLPIYHGTSKEVLDSYAGHLDNTSFPVGGESTHSVISAHTGFPTKTFFDYLTDMENGDAFYIHVLDRTLKYEVDKVKVIDPEDTSDLYVINGEDHVTLLTCTPYGVNTHRLIVRGTRVPYNEESNEAFISSVSVDSGYIYFFGYRISFLTMGILIACFVLVVAAVVFVGIRASRSKRKRAEKEQAEKAEKAETETGGGTSESEEESG